MVAGNIHAITQVGTQRAEGEGSASAGARWLARFALHRPELRAWAMYDWANSAVWTSVIAAIFPVYFYKVAGAGLAEGAARWVVEGGGIAAA